MEDTIPVVLIDQEPSYVSTVTEESKIGSASASRNDDGEYSLASAILACIMCLLFSLLVAYFLCYLFITESQQVPNTLEDDESKTPFDVQVFQDRPNRPIDPSYVRRDLRGLLCHSHADGFLGAVIPSSCDFVMVDVPLLPPQRHPLYSYMTTIRFKSAHLQGHIFQHVKTSPDAALLLVVERSVLRSTAFSPQAVIRGLVQKVVDMKGHGIVLSDHEITDADTADILADSQTLSDEVQTHHGLIRYDVFSGNRSALRAMMLDVARQPSVTFVYRMSGISRTFTHLYFDNFYSKRMNEENL
ncbi:hypothetical protein MTO96_030244, partial [Rhipicephalus appendiculatus]